MRKFLLAGAVGALLVAGVSVDVAGAQVAWPEEWEGHGHEHCEAPTHLAWYDPRRDGQTVYDPESPNGDSAYYVDDDPFADFQPSGNYPTSGPNHDCDGTRTARATAYVGITVQGELMIPDQHAGFPRCPRNQYDDRNPRCEDPKTGVHGAFYVGNGNDSTGVGYAGGVTNPFSEGLAPE